MSTRSARRLALLAIAASTLTSCFTGERPSFEDDDEPEIETISTGDADIDQVLRGLSLADRAEFDAAYEIETRFGGLMSTAEVSRRDDGGLSVTVERSGVTTEFTVDAEGRRQTCNMVTGECESSLNDARISDVAVPHSFYGPSFANRLRVSADRRIGQSSAYVEQIAGQEARCVDVTVAGGTETFCTLDGGPLARFVGNDVAIELTRYSAP